MLDYHPLGSSNPNGMNPFTKCVNCGESLICHPHTKCTRFGYSNLESDYYLAQDSTENEFLSIVHAVVNNSVYDSIYDENHICPFCGKEECDGECLDLLEDEDDYGQ